MLIAALLFVTVAALIHGYIFVLESITWTSPSTRRVFGIRSDAEAEAMKPMAFNQGFYNLFLAVMVLLGVVVTITSASSPVGPTLIAAGAGSMVAAGTVLAISSPRLLRSALIQLVAPAIGLILLAFAVLL